MIILFGPPGAGKSVQGQILAARHGWRWLSTGQLLRNSKDPAILKQMGAGALVDDAVARAVFTKALEQSTDQDRVVIDGYPRELSQAKWLVENQPLHGRSVDLVLVLEVPEQELLRRLERRHRADDTVASRKERLQIYNKRVKDVTEYLNQQKIAVVHINGTGTVGEVHDRIESELKAWHLL